MFEPTKFVGICMVLLFFLVIVFRTAWISDESINALLRSNIVIGKAKRLHFAFAIPKMNISTAANAVAMLK